MNFLKPVLASGLAVFFLIGQSLAADEFVIALKPDKDPDKMLQEREQLGAALSQQLGRPVKVIVPLSAAVILEGLSNGSIDAAYVGATEMLTIRKAGAGDLLLANEINGKTGYDSYWVCLKEKPYQSVADLQGKPVAFASRTSTSGYLIPLRDLVQKQLVKPNGKLSDFFGAGNTWFGSGYVTAIDRVLSGEAEAAAVSYYVLDENRHLSPEQKAKLRMLASQGPVPTHVIAVAEKLNEADRKALKEALLQFNTPENSDLRDQVFTAKLVEVDPEAHLQGVAEAVQLTETVTP